MRLPLKKWIAFGQFQKEIAAGQEVVNNILDALRLSDDELEERPWFEARDALFTLLDDNKIGINFPILRGSKIRGEPPPWDYPEREWYYWVHLFSSKYGWTVEYIAEMDVDDAVALMQEIELDRQLEKEWEYQISEVAYPYDASTKKQRFKPLSRPGWMSGLVVGVKAKVRRIHKSMLPAGVVIKVNEDQDADTP